MNFALMHDLCNERKNATNLEVARLLIRFSKMQDAARKTGARGATLHDVLASVGGEAQLIKFKVTPEEVQYTFLSSGDPSIRRAPLLT
jgi:hypothetical protein